MSKSLPQNGDDEVYVSCSWCADQAQGVGVALELWSTPHPRGQRVEDKIEWAKDILMLYKDWSRG